MLKILNERGIFLARRSARISFKRFFLSNAYKCTESWQNRLRSPVFQKVDFDNLYHELDVQFKTGVRVSVLDVDLLVNHASSDVFKDEVEDVLIKLRSTPESGIVPERTNHAFIRFFVETASKEELLNYLGDRLTYGLFPDYYLTNLLMDKFLKENDPVSAVKIAVLQMLQENFDNPIMKVLALHCCYNYLLSPDIWAYEKEPEADPDDDDVKKVRVRFLRNPYFDDHFDIRDTNHLVGKTLWLFGMHLGGSWGATSQLLGLVLYEKYNKAASFLEDAIKNSVKLHAEAVEKAKEFAINKPKQKENPEGESKPETSEDVDKWKSKVLDLLSKVDKNNLISGDLLSESKQQVKKAVEENEKKDIEAQSKVYQKWEEERDNHIKFEMELMETKKIKAEIQQLKKDLEKEEQQLFFFDKEGELEIAMRINEEKMKKVVTYKPKGKEKGVEEYIPPDVQRKNS